MKKFMSKAIAISMACTMALSMTACSTSSDSAADAAAEATTEAPQVTNPMVEVPESEMIEQTGIELPAPEGAENVTYYTIDNGDQVIAEMDFTLDGHDFYLRACSTDLLELDAEGMDATSTQGFDLESGNISGLCYEWDGGGEAEVNYCVGTLFINSGSGAGYIAWIDVVPGILYNLCMKDGATQDILADYANKVFVPLQGDSDGEDLTENDISESFSNLLENIYATKAGSAGSSSRVTAAATQLREFVSTYGSSFTAQSAEALALETLENMNDGEDFVDNFKECFDAVVEEATSTDKNLETDVSFNQIVNGINNALDQIK